jgi:hypothetical protein
MCAEKGTRSAGHNGAHHHSENVYKDNNLVCSNKLYAKWAAAKLAAAAE